MAARGRLRGGKPALTWYRRLEIFAHCSYIECALETGRTHQIRVHMASIGHPLVGDPVYGKHDPRLPAFRRQALARFVALPESPLERRESLEQLRALEAGMRIACARVTHAPFGVDTPADLDRARAELAPSR